MTELDAPFIGIDLGGTHIGAAVLAPDNTLLASQRAKTHADRGTDAVLDRIVELVHEVIGEAGVAKSDVAGVGIGAPGALDYENGIVLNAVNLRWRNMPLTAELGKRLGLPVVVDNDVNVGAWGEYKMGAGRGHDDMLGIFVGTGVGGGLVLNGQLYRGANHTAGEIGQTIINADAPLGSRTLENHAGRNSIVAVLRQLIHSNHLTTVPELKDGTFEQIPSHVLAEAVASGDELVSEVIDHAAHCVGVSIANTVTLLSLSAVVLGGGVSEALGEPWRQRVQQSFQKDVFPSELRDCPIVMSELEDKAGMLGAALLARDRLAATDLTGR